MIATFVYALCALTSITCAALLLRGWRRSRARLLLVSGLAFAFLAGNNVLLFIDKMTGPSLDLSLSQDLTALTGMLILVFGLIWNTRRDA